MGRILRCRAIHRVANAKLTPDGITRDRHEKIRTPECYGHRKLANLSLGLGLGVR